MEIKTFEDLAKVFGTHHDEVKNGLKILTEKAADMSARQLEIEQRVIGIHRNSGGAGMSQLSLGSQFIEQDGVRAFSERGARADSFGFEAKATITSATSDAAGSAGAGVAPYRDPTITELPRRQPVVRSLLPVIPISGNSVEVVRVKNRTNNAAPVAEGQLKPQSDLQLALDTVPARVIAHHMKASRQVLSDLPQLAGLIDTELLDGLALVEDAQILGGDGTGQNLEGLIPAATLYTPPIEGIDDTMLDTIGLAMLQSALAKFPASGIVMHPADWTRITLLKDGQGNYIMGKPGTDIAQRLWGLPVVTTEGIDTDHFLLGDFRRAATLYDRWTARVEIGTVDDDFTRNLVTVLAEERLAQAVKQPLALTYGSFGNG